MRIRLFTVNGIVSTYAGDGETDYKGDNLAATATSLNVPVGVTVSVVDHNVYLTESAGNLFRVIESSSGIVSVLAGQGVSVNRRALLAGDDSMATSATLNAPTDVFIDTNGLIYLSDSGNYEVRVLTSNYPTVLPTMMPSEVPSEAPTLVPTDAPSIASYVGTVNGDVNTDNLGQGMAMYGSTAMIAGNYSGDNVVFVYKQTFSQWSYTSILTDFTYKLSDSVAMAIYDSSAFIGDSEAGDGTGTFEDCLIIYYLCELFTPIRSCVHIYQN